MMPTPWARNVSTRVNLLIARHHGGDRRAAAHALGISPETLSGMLTGDWREFTLDALTALVLGHGVTVPWLLGLEPCAAATRHPTSSGASHAIDHPAVTHPHG